MWAFGYGPELAKEIWDPIPLDTDVVVTHTPPKYHCDESNQRRAAGCEGLREALWRIRPRLAICGHIHEGRGSERVRWDLGAPNIKFKEEDVQRWEDPGKDNKKMSIIDLSSKAENPIRNDGSTCEWNIDANANILDHPTVVQDILAFSDTNVGPEPTATLGISRSAGNLLVVPPEAPISAVRGQGGVLPSQRCDLEALSGRMGRLETCVVNAAIMASSWPHRAGGKKFNKPIVVDIDLPISNR
jgi:hypothetical protein